MPSDNAIVDEVKLGELGKWIAGAMTVLAAALTFLGMQGGALDRMLRKFPGESMLTFCLVGAAVLAGVLSPAIREGFRVRLSALVFSILVLGAVVAYTLPNIQVASFTLRYSYPMYVALGIACIVFWRAYLALRGAVLVMGLALLTMGTYAGVKLSVLSKSELSRVPRVSASVQRVDGEYVVQARVRATALTAQQYVVLEIAQGEQHSWLRCDPDDLGNMDETVSLPVTVGGTARQESVRLAAQFCNRDCTGAASVEKGVLEWTPTPLAANGVAKLETPNTTQVGSTNP